MYIYMYICVVYMYIYVNIFTCKYICIMYIYMCIYIYNHNTSEEWRGAGRRFAESRSRLNYYQQFVSLPQQQFDEISCKLDSTDYVRSFRKYLKCFLWLTNHVLGYSWGSKPQCIKTGSLSLSTMKKNPGTQVRILVRNINASLLTLSLKAKHIFIFSTTKYPPRSLPCTATNRSMLTFDCRY